MNLYITLIGPVCEKTCLGFAIWPRGYKTLYILKANEHDVYPAH